jgi:uncharacterized ferritin-like protein (DUF455 family)
MGQPASKKEATLPALLDLARGVLFESNPETKAAKSLTAAALILGPSPLTLGGLTAPPDRPGRPEKPILLSPREMPRRRKAQSEDGRKALLHALAHIELNAIDLAWDIIPRFISEIEGARQYEFAQDWARVASDESRHFLMLQERLRAYSIGYGELPAHDGLWETATLTANDLLARLALVPLLHEARGLDVTPGMVIQLAAAKDEDSAVTIQKIHDDEISHVAVGQKWFSALCRQRGLDPRASWQGYVETLFTGSLKPPFNHESRNKAGFPSDWYEPLAQLD